MSRAERRAAQLRPFSSTRGFYCRKLPPLIGIAFEQEEAFREYDNHEPLANDRDAVWEATGSSVNLLDGTW